MRTSCNCSACSSRVSTTLTGSPFAFGMMMSAPGLMCSSTASGGTGGVRMLCEVIGRLLPASVAMCDSCWAERPAQSSELSGSSLFEGFAGGFDIGGTDVLDELCVGVRQRGYPVELAGAGDLLLE